MQQRVRVPVQNSRPQNPWCTEGQRRLQIAAMHACIVLQASKGCEQVGLVTRPCARLGSKAAFSRRLAGAALQSSTAADCVPAAAQLQ